MSELLAEAAGTAAFRPALPLEQLAELHIPFRDLGFSAEPEAQIASAVAQATGLTLVVGEPGNGKSSLLAFLADALFSSPAPDDRLCLPLFVPVASRGEDAADLETFGAMAAQSLLGTFDDLTDQQRQLVTAIGSDEVTRQLPSNALNAKVAAKIFGAGVEGGVESRDEVVTVTAAGASVDEYGGLATLAHTLRARKRELILIIEDTDGWTLQDGELGSTLARRFFGSVLAPLATAEVSVVVALQTHWTREVEEFTLLNERAIKRVTLPTFGDRARAEQTVRSVVARRLDWKLSGTHDAAQALTDGAVEALATDLAQRGSIRTVLTLLRDALDRLDGAFPARLDTEHLVETV